MTFSCVQANELLPGNLIHRWDGMWLVVSVSKSWKCVTFSLLRVGDGLPRFIWGYGVHECIGIDLVAR
jgi:hypothetical protein